MDWPHGVNSRLEASTELPEGSQHQLVSHVREPSWKQIWTESNSPSSCHGEQRLKAWTRSVSCQQIYIIIIIIIISVYNSKFGVVCAPSDRQPNIPNYSFCYIAVPWVMNRKGKVFQTKMSPMPYLYRSKKAIDLINTLPSMCCFMLCYLF